MIKKSLVCFIVFTLTLSTGVASNALKLRVIVEQANVHLNPNLDSATLTSVPKGALLESTHKVGEWFIIILPPDDRGYTRQGYIHTDMVEVIDGEEEIPAAPPQPPPPPPTPPPVAVEQPRQYEPPTESYGVTYEKLFSGFVTKFGWLRSPDPGGMDKGWIVGLNYDIGLSRNFALGIEIMPAYRNYSEIDLQIFPIMGFVNLKAGFNMGDLVKPLGFMNPYAGVGAGLDAAYTRISFEGESFTNFSTLMAYHIFLGLQLKLGSIKLIGEYQWVRVSDPNVNPNFWRHYLLFGFRFGR